VGGLLLGRSIHINSIRLGLDTLVYCSTFVVVGFRLFFSRLLSRMYAIRRAYTQNCQRSQVRTAYNSRTRLVIGAAILLAGLIAAL